MLDAVLLHSNVAVLSSSTPSLTTPIFNISFSRWPRVSIERAMRSIWPIPRISSRIMMHSQTEALSHGSSKSCFSQTKKPSITCFRSWIRSNKVHFQQDTCSNVSTSKSTALISNLFDKHNIRFGLKRRSKCSLSKICRLLRRLQVGLLVKRIVEVALTKTSFMN